jgi:hypothetical protein
MASTTRSVSLNSATDELNAVSKRKAEHTVKPKDIEVSGREMPLGHECVAVVLLLKTGICVTAAWRSGSAQGS